MILCREMRKDSCNFHETYDVDNILFLKYLRLK